jgi:hypothetical protein
LRTIRQDIKLIHTGFDLELFKTLENTVLQMVAVTNNYITKSKHQENKWKRWRKVRTGDKEIIEQTDFVVG